MRFSNTKSKLSKNLYHNGVRRKFRNNQYILMVIYVIYYIVVSALEKKEVRISRTGYVKLRCDVF